MAGNCHVRFLEGRGHTLPLDSISHSRQSSVFKMIWVDMTMCDSMLLDRYCTYPGLGITRSKGVLMSTLGIVVVLKALVVVLAHLIRDGLVVPCV